ncbi:MAG: ComF family protein, partial [Oscillibacter sp.]|nr:ComF family protein [Oscillibacter sp.]
RAALDLLFPPKCPFCGRLSRGICPDCDAALPWTGEADGVREIGFPVSGGPDHFGAAGRNPTVTGGTGGFSLPCAGALRYEGLAREGLLRMKFRGRSAAAEAMGALIAQCAAERFGGEFDTVTWVPVSAARKRKRGYDQAELLSRAACRLWDTRPVRLLDKVRDNPAQSGISDAAARTKNVSGVYRPHGGAAGRKILLIDDICTTGATLRECAAVLYQSGAASVVCAAVALAGGGTDADGSERGMETEVSE